VTSEGRGTVTDISSFEGNDRLTSSAGGASTTYVNDALGQRTSQTTGGVTTTFGWDGASRLVSRSRGGESAAYAYDGVGQRTRAVVAQAGVTTTATYTYDGITLLSLSATRGSATFSVAYLTGEDARPYAGVYRGSETTVPVTFLIASTDRGDVVALTNTAGAVFARYTYDPYGRVLAQDANTVFGITSNVASAIRDRQPLRYAGYTYDAHSATYYLSQRHYDPATMRFLTKDPARDDGEESAYQYCAGDPVGKVDPTGEAAVHAGGGQFARDITREYFALMRRNFRMAQAVYRRVGGNWHAKTAFWVAMVYTNAPWDLKRKRPRSTRRVWAFQGSGVTPADLGNIHYGYVGKALRYSDEELVNAGGLMHVSRGTAVRALGTSNSIREFIRKMGIYEQAGDKRMIRKGIALFRADRHKERV
jgi:RHS repeat-associated protein